MFLLKNLRPLKTNRNQSKKITNYIFDFKEGLNGVMAFTASVKSLATLRLIVTVFSFHSSRKIHG